MRRHLRIFSVLVLLAIWAASGAFAQNIEIDWATKKVVSQPNEIHKGDVVDVSVTHVNNILYDYVVDVQLLTTNNSDDLAQVLKLVPAPQGNSLKLQAEVPLPTCESELAAAKIVLQEILDNMNNNRYNLNPSAQQGRPIPLHDTEKGWADGVAPMLPKLERHVSFLMDPSKSCTSDAAKSFLAVGYHQFDVIRKKVDGPHVAQGRATASAGDVATVRVTVTEKSSGKPVGTPYVVTLQFSSVLTLSGGVLFSNLQDRTYLQRTIPTANGTMNVLGVDNGSSPVPLLVGLLNYRIPYIDKRLDPNKWGIDISTGPVLRLGGQSSTSGFGYFAGLSFHLWNRLFITPGLHVGEFADFPAGFTLNQPIPASFGQLVPVKRWTARFAIGITYKTLDLGGLKPSSPGNTPKQAAKQK